MMKTTLFVLQRLALLPIFVSYFAQAQGDLIPPGPPGPTQTSLQDIWEELQSLRAAITAGEDVAPVGEPVPPPLTPPGPPGPTQVSLLDIWEEVQNLKTTVSALDDDTAVLGIVVATAYDAISFLPAAYAGLGLYPVEADDVSEPAARATTDHAGDVVFPGVAPGTYRLRSVDPVYAYTSEPFEVRAGLSGKPIIVELTRARVQRTVRVLDATTNQPVSGATVSLSGQNVQAEATTNAQGTVLLNGLPIIVPGEVSPVLAVSKSGYTRTQRPFRVTLSNPPVTFLYILPEGAKSPQVVEGRVIGGERADQVASIMGYVYSFESDDDEPIEGVRVSLDDSAIPPVYTDARGYFYFSDLVDRRVYTILAEKPCLRSETLELRALSGDNRDTSFYLFAECKVSVFGAALEVDDPQVTIWSSPATPRLVLNAQRNVAPIDGDRLRAGTYSFSGASPGFRVFESVVNWEVRDTGIGLAYDPSFSFTIVRLYLGGTVRDRKTGAPLAGVQVRTEPPTLEATTDANGRFYIVGGTGILSQTTPDLIDGQTYLALPTLEGYVPAESAHVSLDSSSTIPLDLGPLSIPGISGVAVGSMVDVFMSTDGL